MPTVFNGETGKLLVLDKKRQWAAPKRVKNPESGEELYHDGDDWKPVPMTDLQTKKGALATVIQGLTIGSGDEISGALEWATGGSYEKARDTFREDEKRYGREAPVYATGLNIAGAIPAAIATGGGALTLAAKALPAAGRIGQAAVVGSGAGATAGFASGEDGFQNRAISGTIGAVMGGTLGGTLGALGEVITYVSPAVYRLAQYFRSNPKLVDASGGLTPQGSEFIAKHAQKTGSNPAEMSAELQSALAKQAQAAGTTRSVNPAQAMAVAEAETLPVPGHLTTGQITGKPDEQMFESQAYKGVFGEGAQLKIADAYNKQHTTLVDNLAHFRDRLAGETSQSEPGTRGQAVQNILSKRRDVAHQQADDLYTAARQGGDAAIDPHKYRQIVQTIIKDVAQNFDYDSAPKVSKLLTKLVKGAEHEGEASTLVSHVFRSRRQLTSLQGEMGAEGAAAGAAKKSLDTHVLGLIDDASLSGDKAAIQRWKDAILSWRNYGDKYEAGDLIEKLTERAPFSEALKVAPEDAMNLIFGRSDTGFIGKMGMAKDLRTLREHLGVDSDAWKALREETFLRFANQAKGAVGPTEREFSGANLSKAWNDALQKNPEIMRTIFTDAERSMISQFVRYAQRVTTSVPGGVNTSNSAGAVAQWMRRWLGSAIVGPKMAALIEGMPFLKGIVQLPDQIKAAGAAIGRAEMTNNNPIAPNVKSINSALAAEYAGQEHNR